MNIAAPSCSCSCFQTSPNGFVPVPLPLPVFSESDTNYPLSKKWYTFYQRYTLYILKIYTLYQRNFSDTFIIGHSQTDALSIIKNTAVYTNHKATQAVPNDINITRRFFIKRYIYCEAQ